MSYFNCQFPHGIGEMIFVGVFSSQKCIAALDCFLLAHLLNLDFPFVIFHLQFVFQNRFSHQSQEKGQLPQIL